MSASLLLSEDQMLLFETAKTLFAHKSPLARLRHYRDEQDPDGFDRILWQELADQGWVGLAVPEAKGGAGLGLPELCLLMEAAGRQLAVEPLLSTVAFGAPLLAAGSWTSTHEDLLGRTLEGQAFFGVAWEQTLDLSLGTPVSTDLPLVLDGHVADALLLQGQDGSWWCIPTDRSGVQRRRDWRMDCRQGASFQLKGLQLEASDQLRVPGAGADQVEGAIIALSAEMLGAAEAAFEQSIEYLKTREQFGRALGSFQALQHRAARLYIRLNLARSAVLAAAREEEASPRMASLAKAAISETFLAVAKEAVQFHGGIGMTDECDIGFYLKRAQGSRVMAGDEHHHRDRWARLGGY